MSAGEHKRVGSSCVGKTGKDRQQAADNGGYMNWWVGSTGNAAWVFETTGLLLVWLDG